MAAFWANPTTRIAIILLTVAGVLESGSASPRTLSGAARPTRPWPRSKARRRIAQGRIPAP